MLRQRSWRSSTCSSSSWRCKNSPKRVFKALEPASADRALAIGRTIDGEIRRYLAVKTGVSLGMAVLTGLLGWAFGLDFWFLWAVLMFLANYVTYVGSVVACVPPIAIAYLQFTSPAAATVLAALIIVNRIFLDRLCRDFLHR